jgi:LPS-assembly lipoprotein
LWSRRAALRSIWGAALVAGLGGCGFRPLYAPVAGADGAEHRLQDELSAVRVAPMNDRLGQVMRRELQRKFDGSGGGDSAARFELQVGLAFSGELGGYRRDGFITRVRYNASAPWTLRRMGTPAEELVRATARTIDSFNVPDNQFFAADSSREALERRLIDELSDQIFRSVAIELRRRLEARPAA